MPRQRPAALGTARTVPTPPRRGSESSPRLAPSSSATEPSEADLRDKFPLDTGGWLTLALLLIGFYDVLVRAVNDAFGEHIVSSSSEVARRLDPRRLLESPALEWLALFVVAAARVRGRSPVIGTGHEEGSMSPGMRRDP